MMCRRDWIRLGFAAAAAASLQPFPAAAQTKSSPAAAAPTPAPAAATKPAPTPMPVPAANKVCSAIELSDVQGIASEMNINVTSVTKTNGGGLLSKTTCEQIDRSTYTKVKKVDAPWFVPEIFRTKEVKKIPNSQLLLAGVVAGSITEIVRISLLYPLDTVKNRIQADPRHRKARTVKRKVQALGLNFLRKFREGDLYAGIVPAVLVSVPSSGVYCGIRDVTKRILAGEGGILSALPHGSAGPVIVSLVGAVVADVASLAVRTPVDVLALRLQVGRATGDEAGTDLREALGDGWARLPTVIKTDLPYLLSRIALNYAVLTGTEGLGRYSVVTVTVACACAFLTTPYDVVRTRILLVHDDDKDKDEDVVPSPEGTMIDPDEEQTEEEGSRRRDSVLRTMVEVAREGEGGVQNLFAGSIERTVYYGIGRAWLDPIRLVGYWGIRDAVLLQWFD